MFVLTCDNVIKINFTSFTNEYFSLGSPACMIIPVKPIDGVERRFHISKRRKSCPGLIKRKPSKLLSSGIQILNPKKINNITKSTDSFNNVWKQLMNLNELKCSRKLLESWYSVDDIVQLEKASKNR